MVSVLGCTHERSHARIAFLMRIDPRPGGDEFFGDRETVSRRGERQCRAAVAVPYVYVDTLFDEASHRFLITVMRGSP